MDFILELTFRSSFDGTESYSLTRESAKNDVTEYRARHHKPKHFGSPTDSIDLIDDLIIPSAKAEEFIKRIEKLSLPFYPDFAAGLDGTTTTLKITHGLNSVELSWWEDLPKKWNGLDFILQFFGRI